MVNFKELKNLNHKCYFCNLELNDKNKTIDHLIPKSRGGSSTKANVRIVCNDCNNAKDLLTEKEFIKIRNEAKRIYNELNLEEEIKTFFTLDVNEKKRIIKILNVEASRINGKLPDKKIKCEELKNKYKKINNKYIFTSMQRDKFGNSKIENYRKAAVDLNKECSDLEKEIEILDFEGYIIGNYYKLFKNIYSKNFNAKRLSMDVIKTFAINTMIRKGLFNLDKFKIFKNYTFGDIKLAYGDPDRNSIKNGRIFDLQRIALNELKIKEDNV